MVKTLELALTRAASLPEAAQEQLGRELLERIEALATSMPENGQVIWSPRAKEDLREIRMLDPAGRPRESGDPLPQSVPVLL
jgi:hypothetical protein